MKLFKTLFIVIMFFINGCAAQQKIKNISYKAHTRGSNLSISITKNTLIYKKNTETVTQKLSENNYKKLQEILAKIALEEIKALDAPSALRFTDAAMHANFSFIKDTATYVSKDFDAKNPPKELKELEDFLYSLLRN